MQIKTTEAQIIINNMYSNVTYLFVELLVIKLLNEIMVSIIENDKPAGLSYVPFMVWNDLQNWIVARYMEKKEAKIRNISIFSWDMSLINT